MLRVIRVAAGVVALATLVAGASSAGAAPAGRYHALRISHDSQVSSNWAGYAVAGADPADGSPVAYTDVTGSWIQPKVTCTPGTESYSAFWIGLGGFSDASQALEQIGTESDCTAGGKAVYAAWYEIIPAPSIPLRIVVRAGDRMTAAVLVQGTQLILQLTNETRHVRVTKTRDDGRARHELGRVDRRGAVDVQLVGALLDAAAGELPVGGVLTLGCDRERARWHDQRLRLERVVDRAIRGAVRAARRFDRALVGGVGWGDAERALGRRPGVQRRVARRVGVGLPRSGRRPPILHGHHRDAIFVFEVGVDDDHPAPRAKQEACPLSASTDFPTHQWELTQVTK